MTVKILRKIPFLLIPLISVFAVFADADVTVLCYHRIIPETQNLYDVSVLEFEKQIKTLIDNGYKIIKIKDFLEGIDKKSLPEKACIITIDDGDISSYENVYPIIKKYKIPVTFFIYTDYISRGKRSVSWEKLGEMIKHKSSLVDIGSHTRTHPYLTRLKVKGSKELDMGKIEKEIAESKKIIEDKLKISIKYFAYPYGLYNNDIERIVIRSGYEASFTLDWGNNDINTNKFRIKRKLVVSVTDSGKFISIIKMSK